MSEEFTRIASALERIANALEHLHIEKIDHAHIDDIVEKVETDIMPLVQKIPRI